MRKSESLHKLRPLEYKLNRVNPKLSLLVIAFQCAQQALLDIDGWPSSLTGCSDFVAPLQDVFERLASDAQNNAMQKSRAALRRVRGTMSELAETNAASLDARPGAAGAIVVHSRGDSSALMTTLRSLRAAPRRELIVVASSLNESTRRQILQVAPDAVGLESRSSSRARSLNCAVEQAQSQRILALSDRVVPAAGAVSAHWAAIVDASDITVGPQARRLATEPSPLCHFLQRRQLDSESSDIQNPDALGGDFFAADNASFSRQLWERVGGFSGELPNHYFDVDFGRKVYKAGVRLRFVAAAQSTVQWRPRLDDCFAQWREQADELLRMWELYPDTQVWASGLAVLGGWAKLGDAMTLHRQLSQADDAMRLRRKVDLQTIERLLPLYDRIAAFCFAEAIFCQPERIRTLVAPRQAREATKLVQEGLDVQKITAAG